VGSLTKIGAAIAFASILAAIQFGIAGWFLAINMRLKVSATRVLTNFIFT
jgi:hypothetical protein